ncbi:MAG TPA: hypothetical protein VHT73_13580 [Thermodesulfobacteriota bacterium]|nr:hypothetical protein [Thermodesulfobacteriota bacterium]
MYDNHIYDLLTQMVEEHQSLWRIKNNYKNDVSGCPECQKFWDKLEKDKENHIHDLEKLIKSHIGK